MVCLSPQPKPKKPVINTIAVLVFGNQFLVDKDAEGAPYGAACAELVFLQKSLSAYFLHFAFVGDGFDERQLIGSKQLAISSKGFFVFGEDVVYRHLQCLPVDLARSVLVKPVEQALDVPCVAVNSCVQFTESFLWQGLLVALKMALREGKIWLFGNFVKRKHLRARRRASKRGSCRRTADVPDRERRY